jgi:P4 family phage/plasmid primase-like protien
MNFVSYLFTQIIILIFIDLNIKTIYYFIMDKDHKKTIISKTMRIAVWDKYIGEEIGKTKCLACNLHDISQLNFECGHVIAESKGGETSIENLRPVCNICNKSMATKNLFEFQNKINGKIIFLNKIKQKYNIDNIHDLEILIDSKDFSTVSICKYVNILVGNYLLFVDNKLYCYDQHLWKHDDTLLSKFLSFELYDLLKKLLVGFYFENKMFDHMKKQIKKLNNFKFTKEVIDTYKNIYTNKKIKFDSNKYLIGFNNGVYDLKSFVFRNGKFDDYISMTVGYNYCDKHTNKFNDLLTFFEDIQPNKEERDYLLTYLSIGLVGNLLELFTVLSGIGRNGKSKLIELLEKTFGDYFISIQSKILTKQYTNKSLGNLNNKKIVVASEPEKNIKLNSGFIKFITGRDSITINDFVFTPNFLTLFVCNDIPECDDVDVALSKRLRCVNFPTEFVDEPKHKHQKKINVAIRDNFDSWKSDFMLLLIDCYKKYTMTKILTPTKNILKWTMQYKEDTDVYLQFLNECTEESKMHIKTTTLYERFKNWYVTNNPKTKIPSNREFASNLKKYKKTAEHVKIEGATKYGFKNLQLKIY